jgi:hypothetical protein
MKKEIVTKHICECCGNSHYGSYGSGRFCASKCARKFSTTGQNKRVEINNKISLTVKTKLSNPEYKKEWMNKRKGFFTGKLSPEAEKNKIEAIKRYWNNYWKGIKIEEMTIDGIKKLLMKEQESKCFTCGLESVWNGYKLVLQLHHKDGNSKNNKRENICLLCPNCHSQTDTFSWKNIKKHVVINRVSKVLAKAPVS